MKKVNAILFFTLLLSVLISCTESVQVLDTDSNTVATTILSDTAITIDDIAKKRDSLNTRKYIYLTIDDAPLNGCDYIDSIISCTKIKTSIFLVGNPIHGSHKFRKYHQVIKENSHIEIYNHSYSHAKNRYAEYYGNPEKVLVDFEKNQTDFHIEHKIARLPGRNLWQIGQRKKNYKQTGATSAGLLAENGYQIFGWDIEWKFDVKDNTPIQTIDELIAQIEDVLNNSKCFTSNHVVLLMHNQMFGVKNDRNDLEKLINTLKEYNYTFEYLSSYPV